MERSTAVTTMSSEACDSPSQVPVEAEDGVASSSYRFVRVKDLRVKRLSVIKLL